MSFTTRIGTLSGFPLFLHVGDDPPTVDGLTPVVVKTHGDIPAPGANVALVVSQEVYEWIRNGKVLPA
jgi:hypothetical protein